jgi:hypothetical protein
MTISIMAAGIAMNAMVAQMIVLRFVPSWA